ncbi:RNA-binding S4 domain-containing protein [Sphingomonas sp. GCM10030256]|uniref:RNA-binding S4 domain-containing protein n=1 Tax=Sphingomonas sp. GCM10030256 TaxID=3273427 RepID=UPI003605D047
MRIDKFLFCIRLIKSRTQAQALIEEGRTRLDGRRVQKVSETVKVGSTLALPLRGEVRVLRVLALPVRRGPAPEAQACYEEIAEGGGVDALAPEA